MNTRETLKSTKEGILEIGGVIATDLVKNYGTPLYVYDQDYIEKICLAFTSSLENNYGDGVVSYASKAFCCKEIYRIINKFGMHADIVSYGELLTAVQAGFNPENLCFHGNNKTLSELNFAIENKIGCIVIDSLSEIDLIQSVCEDKNYVQNVLIRVNPGVEAHTHHYIQTAKIDSKFGFSILTNDAEEAILKVKNSKNLNLLGLHCHIGSQIFEAKSFVLAVEKMTDFYAYCKNNLDINFSTLNLGGGFGIYYSENDPKLTISDYENFVKIICDTLISCVAKKGINKPKLIIEPGRSIVGEAGITLYTAGNIKQIKNVKNYIAIDGGMFENPRFALYQAKYLVEIATKLNQPKTIKYSIAGKCCESGDLIAEDVCLPTAKEGDVIAVFSTGAYNYSMASNYNRNTVPPVVMVKDGKHRLIVKGQKPIDLLQYDI